MDNNVTIPVTVSLSAGAVIYAFSIRKENPHLSNMILALMGISVSFISVVTVVKYQPSAGAALNSINHFANNLRKVF